MTILGRLALSHGQAVRAAITLLLKDRLYHCCFKCIAVEYFLSPFELAVIPSLLHTASLDDVLNCDYTRKPVEWTKFQLSNML